MVCLPFFFGALFFHGLRVIVFYDWTAPATPGFRTQAVDCSQWIACDRDGVCDSPCETSSSCAVDCPSASACGNRQCEDSEDYQTCPSDCALWTLYSWTFSFLEWCNAAPSAWVVLWWISCWSTCLDWTGTNFDCVYTWLFLTNELWACDNGLDDDGDGSVDCG